MALSPKMWGVVLRRYRGGGVPLVSSSSLCSSPHCLSSLDCLLPEGGVSGCLDLTVFPLLGGDGHTRHVAHISPVVGTFSAPQEICGVENKPAFENTEVPGMWNSDSESRLSGIHVSLERGDSRFSASQPERALWSFLRTHLLLRHSL